MRRIRKEVTPERSDAAGAARLAAWLREWELDRKLRASALDIATSSPSNVAAAALPARWRPRAGDLVLLHPSVTPACDRPLYVALLRSEGDRAWWVVPFGRFSEPAMNGEWRTGRQSAALRVLCVWNGRKMPSHRLATGWKVGRLTARERSSAAAVEQAWRCGTAVPRNVRAAIGLPVTHPRDPRQAYMAEEARFMDDAAGAADSGESVPGPGAYVIEDSAMLKAADTPPAAPYTTAPARRRRLRWR